MAAKIISGELRGSLADLAAAGLASEPTLRKWIAGESGQPWILKRGSNGDPYEIDLLEAGRAYRAREVARAEEARQRADAIRQLGLDLGLRGSVEEQGPGGLSIAERKQLLEEELVAIKIARMRGELVPWAPAAAAFGDVLVKFRQRGATFASRLAKKIDLSREQIVAIEALVVSDQAELARMMERLGEVAAEGAENGPLDQSNSGSLGHV